MGQTATTGSEPGSVTSTQLHSTSTYKHIKAPIAFILMIIAATGWCV